MKTFMITVTLAIMYLGAQVMIQSARIDKLERLGLRQVFEPFQKHYPKPKRHQHTGD